MMSDDEIIRVVQAHKDGKRIECRERGNFGKPWYECDPMWSFLYFDYRVKSEPREWTMALCVDGLLDSPADSDNRPMVRVREVMDTPR